MLNYILKRLLSMIPVLLLVSFIVFGLLLLIPGDPAAVMLGDNATEEQLIAIRKEMHFDEPFPIQYGIWLGNLLRGDLGRSIHTKTPVIERTYNSIWPTLELAVVAMIIAVAVALPAGIISATRRNSPADIIASIFTFLGVSMPEFWLGILLIMGVAAWLRWLPPSGWVSPLDDLGLNIKYLILPAITLSASRIAVLTRQIRASLLDVLSQDYIQTARAKGVRERLVVQRHALKNAFIPVLTIMGLQLGHLFGGAIIVEVLFAIPGLGRLAVDSIFNKDFPLVQGVVLLIALAVLSMNLIVDVLYSYVDPRIRYA